MSVPLRDMHGVPLEYVAMGLGWDPAHGRRWYGARRPPVDLNASALLFAAGELVDVVYYEKFGTADGSVRLHGDSLDGEGPGDDEILTVDFTRLPLAVDAVALLVTCYTDHTFGDLENAFCRLTADASGPEIGRWPLPTGPHTGLVMGILERGEPEWRFRPVAAPIAARHPVEAVAVVRDHLV